MFILKNGHQPGVYVPLMALFLVSNCEAFCDVVEAYWTDHKLIYCAIDQ